MNISNIQKFIKTQSIAVTDYGTQDTLKSKSNKSVVSYGHYISKNETQPGTIRTKSIASNTLSSPSKASSKQVCGGKRKIVDISSRRESPIGMHRTLEIQKTVVKSMPSLPAITKGEVTPKNSASASIDLRGSPLNQTEQAEMNNLPFREDSRAPEGSAKLDKNQIGSREKIRYSIGEHRTSTEETPSSPSKVFEKLSYSEELKFFGKAVIQENPSAEKLVNETLYNGNPETAKEFEAKKRELCELAGVNFKALHPVYAALRNPAALNQSYKLSNVLDASINGVHNKKGKMYTSLDRTAEGASNLHRRQVGEYTWHTAGVCAAYAHSTTPVGKMSPKEREHFESKLNDFKTSLQRIMKEDDADKIIASIMGEKGTAIAKGEREVAKLAGSDAMLTSFARVFEVLEGMTEKSGNNKILWQRIMAPDIVRAKIKSGLNGDNERLMARLEIGILNAFKDLELNGKKFDIQFINTPINEMAKQILTSDYFVDNENKKTFNSLMSEIKSKLNINPKINSPENRSLEALLALGNQKGRFAKSVFVFAAAQKLGYNIMLGCKSAKDRTGFFSAIASLVVLEIDNLANSEVDTAKFDDYLSKITSGDLNWEQWKGVVALTLPHMFDLPAFNQGLVGLKAGNALKKMWKCFSTQLTSDNPEKGNRAKAFFLCMLLQGSGGPKELISWIPKDDAMSPFNDSNAIEALHSLHELVNESGSLLEIQDKQLDEILNKFPDFSAKLAILDGAKLPKEWIKGASYAGI